ncbi:MAG: aldo/keto reductase [Candidatus Poribacteria bacterium]|jgi:predicted aldo/keto reductase-like oxidoreductase|nr:aldo/keto reductase [Candidatus Poribacteria bacterium]
MWAWEYGQGESERRMGLGLPGGRDQVILMTKVCGREAKTAEEQLHSSLSRLKTEMIDVWQFHEINCDNDAELIFRAGGAIETALAARQAGKIRYIGFTGHKSPHILQTMLDQDLDWDTCQLPTNIAGAHYRIISIIRKFLSEYNRAILSTRSPKFRISKKERQSNKPTSSITSCAYR